MGVTVRSTADFFKCTDNALFLKLSDRCMDPLLLFFGVYDIVHYNHFIYQLRKYIFEGWYSNCALWSCLKAYCRRGQKGYQSCESVKVVRLWALPLRLHSEQLHPSEYKGLKTSSFRAGLFCRKKGAHWVVRSSCTLTCLYGNGYLAEGQRKQKLNYQ